MMTPAVAFICIPAANEPAFDPCRDCQSELWCSRNGCIPVTDPVDEELQQAISDLCNVKDEA